MSLTTTSRRTVTTNFLPQDKIRMSKQAKLFRHLAGTVCQLCERIEWRELERGEQRSLRRTVSGLSSCIHGVQNELFGARKAPNGKPRAAKIGARRR